jgi:hypothetical protein
MEIDAVAAAIPVTANGTHSRRRAHKGCTSTSGTKGGV